MNLPQIPQIYHLGSLQLHTYGLTFALAVLIAYLLGRKFSKNYGINAQQFDDIAFWALIIGFVSARIYYVIFYYQYFQNDFWEIFRTWHGGISIYGGIIGGAAAIYWIVKKHKLSLLKVLDVFALALPLAQAVGRIGNYINHEAFGLPTNLPWKIFIPVEFRPESYSQYSYFHPTFLYEMIWDIIVFLVVYFFAFKKKQNRGEKSSEAGFSAAIYLILYSFGRFWIEAIRLDSSYVFGFKLDQIVSILLFAAGWAILYRKYEA